MQPIPLGARGSYVLRGESRHLANTSKDSICHRCSRAPHLPGDVHARPKWCPSSGDSRTVIRDFRLLQNRLIRDPHAELNVRVGIFVRS
jgi:hypothetical protein